MLSTDHLAELPLTANLILFALGAGLTGLFGVRMTHVARKIALGSGLGEALMGTVFVGAATSLSGIIASITAAARGHAELAVANGLGGIAAQTAFLAIADMAYRKANLEYAAASVENLMTGAFLVTLLAILTVAFSVPDLAWFGIHPLTPVLIAAYLFGVRVLVRTHDMPMWLPRHTAGAPAHAPAIANGHRRPMRALWLQFAGCAAAVGGAGWLLAGSGVGIARDTGIDESLVGGVFIAVTTSLPELVIAVTAVRAGALTLALGDIIGGNTFDTLFIAGADIAYRHGSIYAAVSGAEQFWLAITLVMTGILLMGLLLRERHGPANIGTESVLILLVYAAGIAWLATAGTPAPSP